MGPQPTTPSRVSVGTQPTTPRIDVGTQPTTPDLDVGLQTTTPDDIFRRVPKGHGHLVLDIDVVKQQKIDAEI